MNIVEQIQQQVKDALHDAVIKANIIEGEVPDIILETPRQKENGDYATNIAMRLTKLAKMPPRNVAEAIIEQLDKEAVSIEKIEKCLTKYFTPVM